MSVDRAAVEMPERIWARRMNIWFPTPPIPPFPDQRPEVEYVRSDLVSKLTGRIAELEGALIRARGFIGALHGDDATIAAYEELRALTPPVLVEKGDEPSKRVWQDISTAPKDGTRFLAGRATWFSSYIAFYDGDGELVDLSDGAGWCEGQGPTHWQSLPTSPQANLSTARHNTSPQLPREGAEQ